ncbi:hypothetical protein BT67DRAFT_388597 [Trichocladium antarcticum]|uniref:G-protein coupled receptors family 2 profile 2 domain-containing protein n=1 Tax=Trichocladium antarcticum TaxID=1450529 RepID=A0AAN6UE22_9PEZI|nr:hypothetical protein BT67DRAFT_388597 [Trichocladium antarcticum]
MADLSDEDIASIVAIERGCSTLSLLGCIFVLVTFSVSDAFRQRAINRMVFYATFGNMLTNVATLMTTSYTSNVNSFGCQFQGFLIQVFMQGDAYWALAMAINVYLTFYHKFDARMLRRMELLYFVCCYGIPFVPGFVFLFVTNDHGRPYGNAVLWCWLTTKWEIYRIMLFYGPVWLAIIIAMAIYIRAGREIYNKRRKMLNFSSTGTGTAVGHDPFSPITSEFSAAFNFKTTEVVQTTEIIQPPPPTASGVPHATISNPPLNGSYSVTISADAQPATNPNMRPSLDDVDTLTSVATNDTAKPTPNPTIYQRAARALGTTQQPPATPSNTAAAGPSPNPNPSSAAGPGPGPANDLRARRRHVHDFHNATWAYTKCAILFFSVLLITWLPSSGNRVYSMINGGAVSRPLFFASAFVLPLQGFWNAIIYTVTSWAACKSLWGAAVAAGKEESTSMEDLTGEGRVDRVSPV